jgi:channel protein (hemolysin III family)
VNENGLYSIPGFHDPVSSLTHLLGAVVFAGLSVPLLWRGWGRAGRFAALAVYAVSCVFLLSMSGVYHLIPEAGTGRLLMQRLDHAAIFVLIAGTFTPVAVLLFRGPARWGMLLLMWAAAATAITLKTIFFQQMAHGLGILLYLGLGWLGAVAAFVLWFRYGTRFILPLLWGGLAYTGGAVLEFAGWPWLIPGVVGPHELFHGMVLLGASFHWRFISRLVTGGIPWSATGAHEGRTPMESLKSIEELCVQHQLTAAQLAEKSGLDEQRVLAIVLGRWTPSPAERDAVAAVFGLRREQIAWGHKTPIQHIYGHGPA